MSRKAGAYVLAGVLATTVYYGALVAVSPTFIDLGVADGVPGAVDAPPAHGERKVPATGQHSEDLSRQSRDRNTAYASVGGERPAAPPNPAVHVAAPRPAVVANTARDERSAVALPVEERTRRKLVRRAHLPAILAAWVIAVPATVLLSGGLFLLPARVAGAG